MAAITKATRHVFRAPTKGRDYLTAAAAANAEARAVMDARYPAERADYDGNGRCTYGGWHWNSDPRHVQAQARLARLIKRAFQRQQAASAQQPGAYAVINESIRYWAVFKSKDVADEITKQHKESGYGPAKVVPLYALTSKESP